MPQLPLIGPKVGVPESVPNPSLPMRSPDVGHAISGLAEPFLHEASYQLQLQHQREAALARKAEIERKAVQATNVSDSYLKYESRAQQEEMQAQQQFLEQPEGIYAHLLGRAAENRDDELRSLKERGADGLTILAAAQKMNERTAHQAQAWSKMQSDMIAKRQEGVLSARVQNATDKGVAATTDVDLDYAIKDLMSAHLESVGTALTPKAAIEESRKAVINVLTQRANIAMLKDPDSVLLTMLNPDDDVLTLAERVLPPAEQIKVRESAQKLQKERFSARMVELLPRAERGDLSGIEAELEVALRRISLEDYANLMTKIDKDKASREKKFSAVARSQARMGKLSHSQLERYVENGRITDPGEVSAIGSQIDLHISDVNRAIEQKQKAEDNLALTTSERAESELGHLISDGKISSAQVRTQTDALIAAGSMKAERADYWYKVAKDIEASGGVGTPGVFKDIKLSLQIDPSTYSVARIAGDKRLNKDQKTQLLNFKDTEETQRKTGKHFTQDPEYDWAEKELRAHFGVVGVNILTEEQQRRYDAAQSRLYDLVTPSGPHKLKPRFGEDSALAVIKREIPPVRAASKYTGKSLPSAAELAGQLQRRKAGQALPTDFPPSVLHEYTEAYRGQQQMEADKAITEPPKKK